MPQLPGMAVEESGGEGRGAVRFAISRATARLITLKEKTADANLLRPNSCRTVLQQLKTYGARAEWVVANIELFGGVTHYYLARRHLSNSDILL